MNRKHYLDEIWKPIKGYEGLYDVSNYGRVRSHNYQKKGITQILQAHASKGYYVKVGLRKDDKMRYYRVHRLVAIAFLPPPQQGQTQVEHIDSNKRNNYVKCVILFGVIMVCPEGSNLRWTTPKGNMANEVTRQRISKALKNPSRKVRAHMSAGQRRRFQRERETKTGRYAPPVCDRF